MIDWERTERKTGFGEGYFKKYPKSDRKVYVICDDCGIERWVHYRQFSDLCNPCSQIKNNPVEIISDRSIDWIETKRVTGYDMDYFEKRPGSSKKVLRICKKCRKKRWLHYFNYHDLCSSCTTIERYKDPNERMKISKGKIGKQIGENNPNWKGGNVIVLCDNCGKEIKKKRSQIREHNFCNKKCLGEWVSKNLIGENSYWYKRTIPERARQRMSATKQHVKYDEWENFAVNSPYCPLFDNECRESNRDKYGRCCFLTGLSEENNITTTGRWQRLSVHHVDMDKGQGCDGKRWKLVPLCLIMHGKTHTKEWIARIIWLLNNVWGDKDYRW